MLSYILINWEKIVELEEVLRDCWIDTELLGQYRLRKIIGDCW